MKPTISSGALGACRTGGDDPIELVPRDRQRLLDEDVLAGGERSDHLIGMLVVTRRNDDELKLGILQDGVEIAREHLDLIVAREIAALRAGAADDAAQEIAVGALPHLRHEHRRAERAGADQRVVDPVRRRPRDGRGCVMRVGSASGSRFVRIVDQDAERQHAVRLRELIVGGRRLVDLRSPDR